MENIIFEMKNVKKYYDNKLILKNISLKVHEGEVLCIIGRSGSGKSTLLRIATFLTELDEGEIIYLGENAVSMENGKAVYKSKKDIHRIEHSFGLVFQNFNLFPHWTVLKNIVDPPVSILKYPKEDVEKEAYKLIEKMGLKGRENAYPCELSGGEKQRTAIARALAMKPKMLFFDEPTSALDPELTGEILKTIKELAKEKVTMVIVTHEMNFARDVADTVIYMENGEIAEEGNAYEVITNPKSEKTKRFLQIMK